MHLKVRVRINSKKLRVIPRRQGCDRTASTDLRSAVRLGSRVRDQVAATVDTAVGTQISGAPNNFLSCAKSLRSTR